MLARIAEAAPVDTILSYCRYNLMITDMDQALTPFSKERQIGLINASPLAMRLLTEEGPPDWHPAPPAVLDAARRVARLCREHGAKVSAVALQFCLAHPYVSSTLAGMATVMQVEDNVREFETEPDPELLDQLRVALGPDRDL